MCNRCKYFSNGACEFLLTPETCDEFDLGDKFEDNPAGLPSPHLVGVTDKAISEHHSK